MASEGGSALQVVLPCQGEIPAWKYCLPIEVRASKASEWEREQYENIVGSKRKTGESSQSPGLPSMMRKSHKRRTRKSKVSSLQDMIIGAQQAGMGIEPPSPFDIKNKYLEMEYREMEAYVNQQREKWKTYGTVFLKSVDASNYIKDHKYIYDLLKTVIKEVGKENVVQIVTDNGSAFIEAGKQLMKKYNLYWTPCAAHCIDLIFEDIAYARDENEPYASGAGDWMFKIIQDHWEKTLKHPLHATAYFLNPRFQYRRGVGSDPELLQAVHDVFAKLDPTTESLGQFGNELVLFRDAKRGFGDRAAIAARSTMVPLNGGLCMGIKHLH
ncbi:hypothetical protein CK203_107166 [Vitis vinifera]|uniref:DUF659 domain-containing protein n=1 Tax=Vitis vinifera TaxID=29760 RepID=A0A438CSW9_VITVI|nr:hypothetical protein CK203_107166 [Vitis vinifera]